MVAHQHAKDDSQLQTDKSEEGTEDKNTSDTVCNQSMRCYTWPSANIHRLCAEASRRRACAPKPAIGVVWPIVPASLLFTAALLEVNSKIPTLLENDRPSPRAGWFFMRFEIRSLFPMQQPTTFMISSLVQQRRTQYIQSIPSQTELEHLVNAWN